MHSRYITSFAHVKQLRCLDYPEVAFIGRSNCGKSSLLNALLGRKNLAKTSSRPGRTQMIHLFLWQNKILLADLPGFGYQKTPQSVTQSWHKLITTYLAREEVKSCLCLQDIRRDPHPEDLAYFTDLSSRLPIKIVLTKCDKLSRQKIGARLKLHRHAWSQQGIEAHDVMAVSARLGQNIPSLRQQILQCAST